MKTTRRQFNQILAGSALLASAFPFASHAMKPSTKDTTMPFTLPDLPYADNALEPHVSAETFSFHHKKHHNAYVTKLNEAIEGTALSDKTLEEIILATANDGAKKGVFNNAAQTWNHTFFWNSMKPGGGGKPSGKLAEKIDADFGSFDAFAEKFKAAAATQFGSGWAWLVEHNGTLDVIATSNADLPLAHGKKALLTIDVWEHAYYLDYQNRRPDFVSAFLEHLVNWEFAEKNLG